MVRYFCVPLLAGAFFSAATAQTLKDAVEAAWMRSATGAAHGVRAEEARAKRETARTWFPEPPSISAGYQTDQIDRNKGAREIEIEFELPFATPRVRAVNATAGDAEAAALESNQRAAKIRLAAEVRDAYWGARIARIEADVAQRKLDEANQLAADVERRFQAGDVARVDLNQARSNALAAQTAAAKAALEAQQAMRAFALLTGLPQLPVDAEAAADRDAPPVDEHPLVAAARAQAQSAKARFDQASLATRDPPGLGLRLLRERGESGERYGHQARIGITIPLGSDARNRPRITQANAERIEAETAWRLERERTRAAMDAAQAELTTAQSALATALARAAIARDTQELTARAYRLGELDLPSRLRAEAERFDAELSLARAELEVGRAISRLNQAKGLLP